MKIICIYVNGYRRLIGEKINPFYSILTMKCAQSCWMVDECAWKMCSIDHRSVRCGI